MTFLTHTIVVFLGTLGLFFFTFSPALKAQEEISLAETKPIRVSLSSFYKNKSVFRGAETWPKPSYFVGPGLIFFDKWLLRGPGLFYSHFPRTSSFLFTAGVSYFDDGEPWPDTSDHKEDYRNQRKSTVEASTKFRYKFGYRNSFYLGVSLYKEIKYHYGHFSELEAGLPLLPYTGLHLKMGLGDKQANQYIYGPSGVSGEAYRSASVSVVIPHVPWNGIIRAEVNRSWIVQEKNRAGEYVKGKSVNDGGSMMLVWNLI